MGGFPIWRVYLLRLGRRCWFPWGGFGAVFVRLRCLGAGACRLRLERRWLERRQSERARERERCSFSTGVGGGFLVDGL